MSAEPGNERLRRQLLARIAEYGYTHTGVFDPAGAKSPFTYTIGLPAYMGHPELVMCGVPSETAMGVIAVVVDLLGRQPTLDGRVTGALQRELPVWIAPVSTEAAEAHLGGACWWREEHHDGQPVTARQIIIPDPHGLFPWEPGCEADYGRHQALLLPEIGVRPPMTGDDRARRD